MWCIIAAIDAAPRTASARRLRTEEDRLNKSKLAMGGALLTLLAACASAPEPQPQPVPAPAPAPVQREVAPPPPPAPAPVAVPKRCDAALAFQKDETFPFDRYALTEAAKARLDRDVIGKLADCASVEAIVIEGHADRIGSQQYNQKLSERRADSVRSYLVGKGADRDKIETIGMGKTVPAKFCPDSKKRSELIACLAPNRRAIVSIKGPAR
jgi:OmpA-OmpF porin, OOP family